MINPAEIPQIPGDMEALRGHATTLRSSGSSFSSTGAKVHSTWQGLAAVYDAPEAGQLLGATRPVSAISDSVGGNVELVAAALSTYADTVAPIKARLESLRTQARAFVGSVEGHDDWREDEGKVGAHNQLLSQVNEAVAEWMAAQRTCANAINATYGGTQYVADNGDGRREGNEFGYSKDQLNSAMAGEGLPWGKPEEHDGGVLGDVSDFFVGIKDGAVQMVTDLGALIGYSDGQWSWSTAGTAWKGLGTFALAIGTYSMPGGMALDQSVGLPGFKRGEMGGTLVNAGKSIIAYDQWGKGHNGRAAGQATFNVVSAVIGTKGAGGALRGTGAAIQGAKAAGTGARVGGAMVRAGDFVAKMPTVGELGLKVANKLDVHIPHLGPTPAVAGAGHHVDVHVPETRGPEVARMDGGGHGNGPSLGDAGHRGSDSSSDRNIGPPDGSPNLGRTEAGTHQPADSHHLESEQSGHSPEHGDQPGNNNERNPVDESDVDGSDNGRSQDQARADGAHSGDATPDGNDLVSKEHPSSDVDPPNVAQDQLHSLEHGTLPGSDSPNLPERLGDQPDGSWVNVEHGSRHELPPELNAAADHYLLGARTAEGRISPHIMSAAERLDGAQLRGYPEFVLKSDDSFKRKFAQDLADYPDLPPEEILGNVKDSVRYTIEVPSHNYTDGVIRTVDDLRAKGYENVTFKPTWDNPDTYKGVNSTWRDPATGRVFELQFHTPESFRAKMETHELYEAERVATNEADRSRAAAAQAEVFRQVDVPEHAVERLHDLKNTLSTDHAPTHHGEHSTSYADNHQRLDLDDHPDVDDHHARSDSESADPGDGPPPDTPSDAVDWSAVSGTTDANSKPALHSGTTTPEQAHRYVAEHHPYVTDVNVERFQRGVPGTDQNCSRCVRAVDLGFTGSPASALPWPDGPGWGLADNTFPDYARALQADPADFRKVSSYDDIIGDVAARGEGSRGMVYIARTGSAHVFNVVHDQQGVVFLDGQTGGLATLEKNVDIMYLPIGR